MKKKAVFHSQGGMLLSVDLDDSSSFSILPCLHPHAAFIEVRSLKHCQQSVQLLCKRCTNAEIQNLLSYSFEDD